MEKKYFEIGEEIWFGLRRCKCVEGNDCKGCILEDSLSANCRNFIGTCTSGYRSDNKNVKFIEVQNEK